MYKAGDLVRYCTCVGAVGADDGGNWIGSPKFKENINKVGVVINFHSTIGSYIVTKEFPNGIWTQFVKSFELAIGDPVVTIGCPCYLTKDLYKNLLGTVGDRKGNTMLVLFSKSIGPIAGLWYNKEDVAYNNEGVVMKKPEKRYKCINNLEFNHAASS